PKSLCRGGRLPPGDPEMFPANVSATTGAPTRPPGMGASYARTTAPNYASFPASDPAGELQPARAGKGDRAGISLPGAEPDKRDDLLHRAAATGRKGLRSLDLESPATSDVLGR